MAAKRFDFTSMIKLARDENNIVQLTAQIGAAIRNGGKNVSDAALISERQAANTLKVSRSAVHKAYENLFAEGLVERASGTRCYVVRSFAEAKTGQGVGVILPYDFIKYVGGEFVNQVRHRLLAGVIDRTMHLGLGLRFLSLPPPESSIQEINAFIKANILPLSGLIHLGGRVFPNDPLLEAIWKKRSIPQVFLLSCNLGHPHCGSVTYDAAGGLAAMAQHFQSLGHDKIAVFHPNFEVRKNTLKYTLELADESVRIFRDAGLTIKDEWIVGHRPDDGEDVLACKLDKLLSTHGRPDAIWCRSDKTALILTMLLKERGFRVPDDFSVTGMDNIPEGKISTPPLTTLEVPYYNCGKSAVDMVMAIRAGGDLFTQRTIKIPMTLVVRESTGVSKKQNIPLEPL